MCDEYTQVQFEINKNPSSITPKMLLQEGHVGSCCCKISYTQYEDPYGNDQEAK